MAHLDVFSAIGAFSGGAGGGDPKTVYKGAMADTDLFNTKCKVFYFSIGSAETPAGPRGFDAALTTAGIKHVYYESAGTAHEWQTWRRSLNRFAPLLFQN